MTTADFRTATAFMTLSDTRRDRLTALLSAAERAWRVYDANDIDGSPAHMALSSYHATDAQKAADRLLRVGCRA